MNSSDKDIDGRLLTINVDSIAYVEIDTTTRASKPTIYFVGGSLSLPITGKAWKTLFKHLDVIVDVSE
jgi:hypothetical protein